MDTKKLRQKILDLAIRGKLVPQDPNDEPAFELLKRINPEFEVCENSLYKCVPIGWTVCSIKDIASSELGKTLDREKNKGEYKPYLCSINVFWNQFDLSEMKQMRFEAGELEHYSIHRGDLVICEGGDAGRCAVWPYNDSVLFQNALHRVRFKANIDSHFYMYLLMYLKNNHLLDKYCKGVTIKHFTKTALLSLPVVLPPLNEQKRIVTAIEQWFSLIDILENEKSDLQASIQQAKSKILDLAIHGKLVPQDPNDEPAIELLKRINPKFEECEDEENNVFPNGWSFCRLEDIVDYEQPQAYIVQSTEYSPQYKTPVLTAGKSFIIGYTNEEEGICSNLPVIIFDDFTTESKYVDFPFKVKSSAMKILHIKEGVNIQYVCYFMSITRLIGDTHKRYWISEYSKKAIPLPPKQEQLRIVAKIEELFSVLDSIKESLE